MWKFFIQENALENVLCKKVAISSRSTCVYVWNTIHMCEDSHLKGSTGIHFADGTFNGILSSYYLISIHVV